MKSYPLSGERYPVSASHWTTPILDALDAFSSISDKDPQVQLWMDKLRVY
ncbi:MAG: hypothetical protein OSB19_02120 [Opitutaceae bacterium]|nr:hypothetical protein [Opitutaceae bacterium]